MIEKPKKQKKPLRPDKDAPKDMHDRYNQRCNEIEARYKRKMRLWKKRQK